MIHLANIKNYPIIGLRVLPEVSEVGLVSCSRAYRFNVWIIGMRICNNYIVRPVCIWECYHDTLRKHKELSDYTCAACGVWSRPSKL